MRTVLHVAGPSAQQVVDTMTFTEEDTDKIEPLRKTFEQHCDPRKNRTVSLYHFNSRRQKVGDKFNMFLTDLRVLIKDCEYVLLKNELLMDRLVCGVAQENK